MRFCINRLRIVFIALAFFNAPLRAAIQSPGPANLPAALLEEFRTNGVPDDKWPALMETMGNAENTAAVRELVKEMKPFPAAQVVELLANKRLAVRLGALELLEDAAGETFGFDPWQEDPALGPNADAIAKWKAWMEKGSAGAAKAVPLSAETFRVLAQEVMSDNRDRVERAMLRLEGFGLAAVGHIESFLKNRTDLEPGSRAALKAAEYRIVLRQSLPRQAAALARDLAAGSAEQQCAALSASGAAGATALPIIADFLASPDALVRETAVDAAFSAGGKHAVPLVRAHLKKPAGGEGVLKSITNALTGVKPQVQDEAGLEKTESVLHAMLRGLGKNGGGAEDKMVIAGYLNHADENVVISALESLGGGGQGRSIPGLSGDEDTPSSSTALSAPLATLLADPRWRVRAAALEAIGKLGDASLKDKVVAMSKDVDIFVRVSAVNALTTIAAGTMMEILSGEFEKQHDLKPAILKAIFDSRKVPPPAMWEQIKAAPPEVILQCLDVLDPGRDDGEGKRVPFAAPFATHPNKDVAACALRLLASRGRHSALLLKALKSGDQTLQDAVLDQLHLPPGALSTSGTPAPGPAGAPAASNLKLEQLYSSFEKLRLPKTKAGGSAARPTIVLEDDETPGADSSEMSAPGAELSAVLVKFFNEGSPRQKFSAANSLMINGDENAAKFLLSGMDAFSGVDRRLIAEVVGGKPEWIGTSLQIATRLIRDEAEDVREKTIAAWLNRPALIATLLDEFSRAGSLLVAGDIYGYTLDKMAQSGATAPVLSKWAERMLADESASDAHKVFAIVLLSRTGKASAEKITRFTESKNPWLRRAAYRALGLGERNLRLAKIAGDESAHVRATLPFLAQPHNGGWSHHLDDATVLDDSQDYDRRSSSGGSFGAWARGAATVSEVTPEVLTALEKMTGDPADFVRFEAMFALLRLGKPVDPAAFAGLVAKLKNHDTRYRVSSFMEKNYTRLGRAYAVLAPLVLSPSDSDTPKILKHFGIAVETAFTSFTALAALAPGDNATDTAIAAAPPEPAAAGEQPFRIIFFHKPGCRECDRVREMLGDAAREFPKMLIEERDIGERGSALLNEVLSARFDLNDTMRQVTPAVFAQTGALVKADITGPRLGDFLRRAAAEPPDATWAAVAQTETAAAVQTVERRFDTLSLAVIVGSGLLDGINPCAFATIIFLLSYLQVARRTRGEILAVGVAFITAVFLAYFVVGLGLVQVMARLTALRVAGMVLNYIMAAFALVIAVLSFRDAQLAARGELGEMTLQLPDMLKDRIRGVIRTGARANRFVFAAFGAGLVISFLELACTGQVYLPTIQFMLKAGHGSAIGYLLAYNAAFIVPLIVVFALAFFGLRSDALIRFQRKHTATVKVLTGVLFVLLAAMLVFGHQILSALR